MGKVIKTQEFTRKGKKGIKFTIRQRGVNKKTADAAAVAQSTLKFPAHSSGIEVLGTTKQQQIAGPVAMYTVDVFVPISELKQPPTKSGDVNSDQMI